MAVNFGLIGPGSIADRKLAPAIKETAGAKLWSVTSRSLERASDFAERHEATGPEPAFTDYEEMLEQPDLDAVLVSTPDKLHAEHGIKAARADKHVLMEKPMVSNSASGEDLIKECEKGGVKLGVAYHLRWHRGHRKLIWKIQDGVLGKTHHARVQWSFQAKDDSNWRAHEDVGRWWGLAGVGTMNWT